MTRNHASEIDGHVRRETAEQLHMELLRVSAGLPATGPLDAGMLRRSIELCSGWRLDECPSCTSLAKALHYWFPEDNERETHEGVEAIERW